MTSIDRDTAISRFESGADFQAKTSLDIMGIMVDAMFEI